MAIYSRRIGWIDANGEVRTTQLIGISSMSTVQLALLLLSNADEATESEAQIFVNSSPAPIAAIYQSVTDYAELWYSTSINTIIAVTVPAPRLSIFLADGQTVDPANSNVVAASGQIIGVVSDLAGNVATAFVGGLRRKGG